MNYRDAYDRYKPEAPYTIHTVKHKERDVMSQMGILYEFLTKGIDHEDIQYMKQSYEFMLADDTMGYWLNDTHWVDHCVTDLYSSPPKRRKKDDLKVHASGCARTEGYYKIEAHEKAKYKYHHAKSNAIVSPNVPVTKMQGENTTPPVTLANAFSGCRFVEGGAVEPEEAPHGLRGRHGLGSPQVQPAQIQEKAFEVRQVGHPRLGLVRDGAHRG